MEMQPVNSRDIRLVGYDAEGQLLELEFYSGGIYKCSTCRKPFIAA